MTTTLTEPAAARSALEGLLQNYSFEMTAKDVPQLEEAADLIPRDTKIAITFLPNEAFPARVAAAARVRQLGFVPVPHISARRLKSQDELEGFLAALQREAAIDRAFVVAGDPPQPEGPYSDALAVIRTGLKAGELVVTDGQFQLTPDSPIRPVSPHGSQHNRPPTGQTQTDSGQQSNTSGNAQGSPKPVVR